MTQDKNKQLIAVWDKFDDRTKTFLKALLFTTGRNNTDRFQTFAKNYLIGMHAFSQENAAWLVEWLKYQEFDKLEMFYIRYAWNGVFIRRD
jgi:hypothetical protein